MAQIARFGQVGWWPEMRRSARRHVFGQSLAVIATVMLMAACGSSGANTATPAATQSLSTEATSAPATVSAQVSATTASTTAASGPKDFVSTRYKFRVTLPQNWVEFKAVADWPGTASSGPGSPQFDSYADPTANRTLMIAAAPVPPGTQLEDWRAAMVRGTPDVCPESSPPRKTTIGGEPAVAWTVKCSDGYDANIIAVLHGKRGYIFYMPSATANDDAEDRRVFEDARKSFSFTS
jgi:hypothetical protein